MVNKLICPLCHRKTLAIEIDKKNKEVNCNCRFCLTAKFKWLGSIFTLIWYYGEVVDLFLTFKVTPTYNGDLLITASQFFH